MRVSLWKTHSNVKKKRKTQFAESPIDNRICGWNTQTITVGFSNRSFRIATLASSLAATGSTPFNKRCLSASQPFCGGLSSGASLLVCDVLLWSAPPSRIEHWTGRTWLNDREVQMLCWPLFSPQDLSDQLHTASLTQKPSVRESYVAESPRPVPTLSANSAPRINGHTQRNINKKL